MNGHKYVLYKYRIFDLLNQSYHSSIFDSGVYYSLNEVALVLDGLLKSCVEENRFEVHSIKLANITTLE